MVEEQTIESLSKRLRELEDIEEIRKIYIAYGRYLDDGNMAGYASLFARDAKLRLGGVMRADGREEIEKVASMVVGGRSGGKAASHRTLHLLASPTITVHGDTAIGECVWAAVSAKDGRCRRFRIWAAMSTNSCARMAAGRSPSARDCWTWGRFRSADRQLYRAGRFWLKRARWALSFPQ